LKDTKKLQGETKFTRLCNVSLNYLEKGVTAAKGGGRQGKKKAAGGCLGADDWSARAQRHTTKTALGLLMHGNGMGEKARHLVVGQKKR